MIMDRSDRQSGYLGPDHLGHCERWISSATSSHLVIAAETTRNPRDAESAPATTADPTGTPRMGIPAALTPIIFGTTYLLTTNSCRLAVRCWLA